MTIVDRNHAPHGSEGAQISYNTREVFITSDQVFLPILPVQISSPLGEDEGGKTNPPRAPKCIPAARRLALKDDHSFRNSKNPDRISNTDRINAFLIKSGLDYLNRSYHYQNEKMRSLHDVESHLFSIICDKLKPDADPDADRHAWSFGQCERYAHRAAVFACDVWDPWHFEKQARRGAKGGRKSKRKPTYTHADAKRVWGLTHEEAADVLGVHVSTVRRMRKAYPTPERMETINDHSLLPKPERIIPAAVDLDALLRTP